MIRTREQLLDLLAVHCRQQAIKRALAEGTVKVLGGFNTSPPCWIVRVTSTFKRSWNVMVTSTGIIKTVPVIPWREWAGGKSPLYQGDNPKRCELLRNALRKADAKKT